MHHISVELFDCLAACGHALEVDEPMSEREAILSIRWDACRHHRSISAKKVSQLLNQANTIAVEGGEVRCGMRLQSGLFSRCGLNLLCRLVRKVVHVGSISDLRLS